MLQGLIRHVPRQNTVSRSVPPPVPRETDLARSGPAATFGAG